MQRLRIQKYINYFSAYFSFWNDKRKTSYGQNSHSKTFQLILVYACIYIPSRAYANSLKNKGATPTLIT